MTSPQKWTFSPVDPEAWDKAQERVLLLGADPNETADYEGPRDMGAWFRSVQPERLGGNSKFLVRNIAQLLGALGKAETTFPTEASLSSKTVRELLHRGELTPILSTLRYADLKAAGGGSKATQSAVRRYVQSHLEEVLRFWLPQPGDPAAPTITVVQGGIAHRVFDRLVRRRLIEAKAGGTYVGMPHPSEQSGYESLRLGAIAMRGQLRPFARDAVRWGRSGGVQAWLPFP